MSYAFGQEPSTVASSRRKLLIVDDEPGVRRLLDWWMTRAGFVVRTAASGVEALRLFREHHASIDAVLMDVRMPEWDGPRTFAELKAFDRDLRCCFMTADPSPYTERQLIEQGAVKVVRKPFRMTEIVGIMSEIARSRPAAMPNESIAPLASPAASNGTN